MPFAHIEICVPKPIYGYPQSPRHIGEHIKRRRIELGLRQRDVAEQIGVSPWTVLNWESGETEPAVRFGPQVVKFLGYDPLPEPTDFGQEVWKLRWRRGLTQRDLAAQLHTDDSVVRDWERGEHLAGDKLRPRLEALMRES